MDKIVESKAADRESVIGSESKEDEGKYHVTGTGISNFGCSLVYRVGGWLYQKTLVASFSVF